MPGNVKKAKKNRQKLTACRKGGSENLGHFERGMMVLRGDVLERGGLTHPGNYNSSQSPSERWRKMMIAPVRSICVC